MKARLFGVYFLFYAYSFVRYHLGKGVPYEEVIYVWNKSLSWMSFFLIGISILPVSWWRKRSLNRKQVGLTGFLIAATHVILSVFLLKPSRYPFLYDSNNSWTFQGMCTIGVAIMALAIFGMVLLTSLDQISLKSPQREKILKLGKWGFLIVSLHPFLMGYDRWFNGPWPFRFPPITLLAVLMSIAFWMIRLTLTAKKGN